MVPKKIKQLIEMRRRQGYTITVQDESIVLADARPRKGSMGQNNPLTFG